MACCSWMRSPCTVSGLDGSDSLRLTSRSSTSFATSAANVLDEGADVNRHRMRVVLPQHLTQPQDDRPRPEAVGGDVLEHGRDLAAAVARGQMRGQQPWALATIAVSGWFS